MEKSVFALQAMMGAVYAGCFYVYIDPSQAPARFRQILSVCRPACVVTDRPELAATLGADVRVLNFEELARAETDEEALAIVRAQALDTDPLYCNFTSGSTGMVEQAPDRPFVCVDGLQFFSGTQKKSETRMREELRRLDDLLEELHARFGFTAQRLEYGPGFPVDYFGADPGLERRMKLRRISDF